MVVVLFWVSAELATQNDTTTALRVTAIIPL